MIKKDAFIQRRWMLALVAVVVLVATVIAASIAMRSPPPAGFVELVRERAVFPPECAAWIDGDPVWKPEQLELKYGWSGTNKEYQVCESALDESRAWLGPYFFTAWPGDADFPFSPECDGKYVEIPNSEALIPDTGALEAAGMDADLEGMRTYAWYGTWDEREACYPSSPEMLLGGEDSVMPDTPEFEFTIVVEHNS